MLTMPLRLFAGDPAPQQLTAPCRKYSGRLHPPIEQVVYRSISQCLYGIYLAKCCRSGNEIGSPITFLIGAS